LEKRVGRAPIEPASSTLTRRAPGFVAGFGVRMKSRRWPVPAGGLPAGGFPRTSASRLRFPGCETHVVASRVADLTRSRRRVWPATKFIPQRLRPWFAPRNARSRKVKVSACRTGSRKGVVFNKAECAGRWRPLHRPPQCPLISGDGVLRTEGERLESSGARSGTQSCDNPLGPAHPRTP